MADKSIQFAGGNNITLSTATAANATTITISGANAGGAQTGISSIIASDATFTSGAVRFTGSNAITVKSSADQTVVIDMTQSTHSHHAVQTGISGVQASDATYTSGTVIISGGNNITVSSGANQSINIHGPNTHAQQTGISSIAGSNTTYTAGLVEFTGSNLVTVRSSANSRLVIDASNQNLSAGVSTGGNTSGDTTVNTGSRFVIVGSNNITASQGTAAGATTVTLSGPATHAQQTGISGISVTDTNYTSGTVRITGSGLVTVQSSAANQTVIINATNQNLSAGVSTGGNTAGDTGVATGSRLVFQGSDNITLNQTTGAGATTVRFIGGAGGGGGSFSGGVSTGGNTAGDTGVTGTRLVFAGSGDITASQSTDANGGTITFNNQRSLPIWVNANFNQGNFVLNQPAPGARTWQFIPLGAFPGEMTIKSLYMQLSLSGSTATMSSNYTSSWSFGLYTLNASTLSLLNSASTSFGYAGAATNNSTGLVGKRWLSVHSSLWSSEPALSHGIHYWLGWAHSTGGQSFQTHSMLGIQGYNSNSQTHSGTLGVATVAGAATQGLGPFYAGFIYTSTSASPPGSVASNSVSFSNAQASQLPYVVFQADGAASF